MKILDLSGSWRFAYTRPGDGTRPADFSREITVPGYWDDQKAAFDGLDTAVNPLYQPVAYPMPDTPDASLPYITGTVWYQRTFELEEEAPWAVLELAGVMTEARVWVNGNYAGQAFGYSTPHSFSLDGYLRQGENELIIAVDNDPHERLGCVTRGFKGFSGGLYRGVTLRLTGRCRIADAAAWARDAKFFTIDAVFEGDTAGAELSYKVTRGPRWFKDGNFPLDGPSLHRDIPSIGLETWSDEKPQLYELQLILRNRDGVSDRLTLPFGLRTLRADGTKLLLNGVPVFLRGSTEHGYYAGTCTPPADKGTYRENLTILRDWGFNFLRFHTSVPNEEYMQAADEMGFLVQVEAPVSYDDQEWEEILRFVRRHPCIAFVCGGNEELLDEDKIRRLSRDAKLAHSLAPAALYDPQEALRGVEYGWADSDLGENLTEAPSRHNARRLAALKAFSDVFGQFSWGYLSYGSTDGDNDELDRRLAVYERPCLSHELGIYGSYLDLKLESRYEGTRIGTDLYAKAREYLAREGMLDLAETFYKNSCALIASVRKHNIETARKCRRLAGFDYLGVIDYHWHRTGYPCGILNEFYEEKPFSPQSEVLLWNRPTVLLWNHHSRFTYTAGTSFDCELLVSRYEKDPLPAGAVTWILSGETGASAASGIVESTVIPAGSVTRACTFSVVCPEKPGKYTLSASLSAEGATVRNHWTLWVFEKADAAVPVNVRVCSRLTAEDAAYLEQGGRILLTSALPFPSEETAFRPTSAGRPNGAAGTVIHPHPALDGFPHDGWCDWQFRSMLDGGSAIRYGVPSAPACEAEFRPIVEIVSSFKNLDREAALAEYAVGQGRLLICGLRLDGGAPEQDALRGRLLAYLAGSLTDAPALEPAYLRALIAAQPDTASHLTTDEGFDRNAQVKLTF